jgi:hypothetical protein
VSFLHDLADCSGNYPASASFTAENLGNTSLSFTKATGDVLIPSGPLRLGKTVKVTPEMGEIGSGGEQEFNVELLGTTELDNLYGRNPEAVAASQATISLDTGQGDSITCR